MLREGERYMIRHFYREGMSISEIARRTGHDRKTIRKVVRSPELKPPAKARPSRKRKIDPYIPYLLTRIEKGVYNARKLYHEIKNRGYLGKETQVRVFVQPHRQRRESKATVRFETEPGEQAQVDWAHFGHIKHRGKRRKLYVFIMTLGWSRAMYMEFTTSMDMAHWLRCHIRAFEYFGGVVKEVLHDNLKTAVVENHGPGFVVWNPRYLDLADHYGFRPRACKPYRARTKGKVESGVAYVRGNFWQGLEFTDLADLNAQAQTWLAEVANVRNHGTTHEIPFDRLPHEGLAPIGDKPPYDTSLIEPRRCSRDCVISFESNYYSAPAEYALRDVMIRVTEKGALFILNQQGEVVASHHLAQGSHQRVVIPEHYASLRPKAHRCVRSGAVQVSEPDLDPLPWPDAPIIETRPLDVYQALAEVEP
jgi:transposase